MTLTNEDEYQAAKRRMNELADCDEGSALEEELIRLIIAVEVWEEDQFAGLVSA